MKEVVIFGLAIFAVGMFLVITGYGTSTTFLSFGVFFALVGSFFSVAVPVIIPRLAPAAAQQEASQSREEQGQNGLD